jgi:hypothetical protein
MSSPFKTVVRRLRLYIRPKELRLEIDEELQFHIEMRTRDNLNAGMPPQEARANAQSRFGDYEKVKEDCYASGAGGSLNKIGVRAAAPLVLVFLGLALMIWTMGQPYGNLRGLLSQVLAVSLTFVAFLLIPRSFRRSPIEPSGPILGLIDEGSSYSVPPFHRVDGKSPLERVLEDQ